MFHCRLHNRQSSHSPWTRMDGDNAPVFQCLQSPAVTRREDVIKRDSCYNLIGLAHERGPTRHRSHDPQLMLMCRVFHHTSTVTLHSLQSQLLTQAQPTQDSLVIIVALCLRWICECQYSYLILRNCRYLSPACLSLFHLHGLPIDNI